MINKHNFLKLKSKQDLSNLTFPNTKDWENDDMLYLGTFKSKYFEELCDIGIYYREQNNIHNESLISRYFNISAIWTYNGETFTSMSIYYEVYKSFGKLEDRFFQMIYKIENFQEGSIEKECFIRFTKLLQENGY